MASWRILPRLRIVRPWPRICAVFRGGSGSPDGARRSGTILNQWRTLMWIGFGFACKRGPWSVLAGLDRALVNQPFQLGGGALCLPMVDCRNCRGNRRHRGQGKNSSIAHTAAQLPQGVLPILEGDLARASGYYRRIEHGHQACDATGR